MNKPVYDPSKFRPLGAPHEPPPDTGNKATRADEDGDVAEPDAPTSVDENEGMNTILGGGGGTGVQTDASEE